MRASKSSSSNLPVLLALFALVLVAAGGAMWMLMGDDDGPAREDALTSLTGLAEEGDGKSMGDLQQAQPRPVDATAISVPTDTAQRPESAMLDVDDGTPRSHIEGLVVDPQGQPIQGALVRAFKGNPLINVSFPGSRQRLDTEATSGPDGRFLLERVPIGKDYVVTAEHPDYAPGEVGNLRLRADTPLLDITVRLTTGATVAGSVLTTGEAPIADARVELYDSVANAQTRPADRRPWKVVFTEPDGTFEFTHVSASNLRVRVVAAGYESQVQMLSYALEARPKTENLVFKLDIGHLLTGRVIDDVGAPVQNARIEATSLTKTYQGNVVAFSDAGGHFALDGMGEHFYQVRTTADGHSDQVRPKVHIDDGELLIEMTRRGGVEGWVRTADGSPVTQFTLTLMRAPPGRTPARMADHRDFRSSDGSFEFDNLDPGSFALEARAKGFAPSISETFTLSRESAAPTLTIQLTQGATLVGRVTDPQGQPLGGALVQVNPNDHVETPLLGIFQSLSPTNEVKIKRRTNQQGEYKLEHIMPGTYQIRVDHPEYAPRILNDVVLFDDSTGTNTPLELSMPPGASISGLALDSNRRPMPFTEVQLSMTNGFMEAATTDRDGSFQFGNLSEGEYTLSVKPDRTMDGEKPLNPLMTLVYASKSRREVFVSQGQAIEGFELYLPQLDN